MYQLVGFSADDSEEAAGRLLILAGKTDTKRIPSGWVRQTNDGVTGRFVCLRRELAAAKKLVKGVLGRGTRFERSGTARFNPYAGFLSGFRALPPADPSDQWWHAPYLKVSRIDPRGVVTGWAFSPQLADQRLRLVVHVDDEEVGEVVADKFRLDLLDLGVEDGEFGFAFRLPQYLLDGRLHWIAATALAPDGSEVVRSQAKEVILPRAFTVDFAWRNALGLSGIDAVRQRIIANGVEPELANLLSEWERSPECVFVDAGMDERYQREGRVFLSFRERLAHRLASENCPRLVRSLNSKSFTKDYCHTRGIRTAKTLLVSNTLDEITHFNFPSRFALKPTAGSGKCSFLFDSGLDLRTNKEVTLDDILKSVKRYMADKPNAEFIVEEMLEQNGASGIIPLDYKFHVFGGKVRILQVHDCNVFASRNGIQQGWFSKNWRPAPFPFEQRIELALDFPPPASLPEMIHLAEMVGAECEDYVRVDLYDAQGGVTLGEVTVFSNGGLGFTEWGNRILSQAWHASVLTSYNKSYREWAEST